MNWWNRNRKVSLITLGGLLVLATIVVFLMVSGLAIGGRMCTLVGCVGGLEIELMGLPDAAPYEISIVFPSGETQALACRTGNDESEAFVKSCSPSGAFFSLTPDVAPPKEITVIATVNGIQTSGVFRPDYERFQPNGEDCPPVCYSAKLVMSIAP